MYFSPSSASQSTDMVGLETSCYRKSFESLKETGLVIHGERFLESYLT